MGRRAPGHTVEAQGGEETCPGHPDPEGTRVGPKPLGLSQAPFLGQGHLPAWERSIGKVNNPADRAKSAGCLSLCFPSVEREWDGACSQGLCEARGGATVVLGRALLVLLTWEMAGGP